MNIHPAPATLGVPTFIDLMISESSVETKNLYRNGLSAVEKLSQKEFGGGFATSNRSNKSHF
jgi:hypothetical protein